MGYYIYTIASLTLLKINVTLLGLQTWTISTKTLTCKKPVRTTSHDLHMCQPLTRHINASKLVMVIITSSLLLIYVENHYLIQFVMHKRG
jgi:hypothetical protein